MARKPSPPPPLTIDELSDMIIAHRRWLRYEGKEGQKADLSGANLEGLNLDGYDLSQLDFRGANLARVKFGGAPVGDTSFRAADLREADWSGVGGLLALQLAGDDLASARLPEDLQEFAGLKHVDAATTDANLLNNFAEPALPIINTKINLVLFYMGSALPAAPGVSRGRSIRNLVIEGQVYPNYMKIYFSR